MSLCSTCSSWCSLNIVFSVLSRTMVLLSCMCICLAAGGCGPADTDNTTINDLYRKDVVNNNRPSNNDEHQWKRMQCRETTKAITHTHTHTHTNAHKMWFNASPHSERCSWRSEHSTWMPLTFLVCTKWSCTYLDDDGILACKWRMCTCHIHKRNQQQQQRWIGFSLNL